jgi:hypothetical protein
MMREESVHQHIDATDDLQNKYIGGTVHLAPIAGEEIKRQSCVCSTLWFRKSLYRAKKEIFLFTPALKSKEKRLKRMSSTLVLAHAIPNICLLTDAP